MESLTASQAVATIRPPSAAYRLLSDERLARMATTGSRPAFTVIFERHHQALHRYCRSIVGNDHDAADALQNTMLKAMRALSGETRRIALRPWLYRIAHNESISLLRARRSDGDLEAATDLGDPAAEGVIESRERLRTLTRDLRELTEQQRGALLMRELGGLSFAEVAGALGISAAAAKQSVYEGRCVLQALQEGRAMGCDDVRRALSDGDRRMLRAKRLRGHLRACQRCRDFQLALHERPGQLAAVAPPLPLAAAGAMLNGLLGAAGHGTGGGLVTGLSLGAGAGSGLSLGAKVAAVAVVGSTLAGGAVVVVPQRDRPLSSDRAAPRVEPSTAPALARPLPSPGADTRTRGAAPTAAAHTAAKARAGDDRARAGRTPGRSATASSARARGRDRSPAPRSENASGQRSRPSRTARARGSADRPVAPRAIQARPASGPPRSARAPAVASTAAPRAERSPRSAPGTHGPAGGSSPQGSSRP
jgi:RNA polymerase sigma factor (sigma-70 family)